MCVFHGKELWIKYKSQISDTVSTLKETFLLDHKIRGVKNVRNCWGEEVEGKKLISDNLNSFTAMPKRKWSANGVHSGWTQPCTAS